jgi:hypothetical protein
MPLVGQATTSHDSEEGTPQGRESDGAFDAVGGDDGGGEIRNQNCAYGRRNQRRPSGIYR